MQASTLRLETVAGNIDGSQCTHWHSKNDEATEKLKFQNWHEQRPESKFTQTLVKTRDDGTNQAGDKRSSGRLRFQGEGVGETGRKGQAAGTG